MVVGAGVTGMTAALALQRAGRDVVVLEAERVGFGTTGGSTGKVTSQHGLMYADLIERLGRDAALDYATANQEAVEDVAALADESGQDARFGRASAYVYANSPDKVDALEREFEAATDLGLPAQLGELDTPFPSQAVLEFTDQAYVHPVKYCEALLKMFTDEGGLLHEGTRVDGVDEEDGVVTLRVGDLRVTASHVVVATLLPFIDRGGFFAKTSPSRAYGVAALLATPPPQGMFLSADAPVRSMRPWPGGGETGVIVVGENHKTGHGDATPGRWGELERWAREHLDVESFEYRWSAQDYKTADGVPYVGRSPLTDHVLVATGFNKWGLTNATAAAGMLRDLVLGVDNPHLETFSAGRIGDAKAVREIVSRNADVAKRFVGDKLDRLSAPQVGDLVPGQAGLVKAAGETVAAYRSPDGDVHMVRPACSHLGCDVAWNDAENTWDCPCHGSRFDVEGLVITGPATDPLVRVRINDGELEEF